MNYNDQDIYEDELTRMRDRHAHKTRKMPAESAIGQNAGEAAQERSRTVRSRRRRRGGGLWLLVLAAALFAGAFLFFKSRSGERYWTIAVFGVDSRNGNLGKGALSDVEMLASIDKKTGEIRLVSVFRDSYLKIAPDDYDKINEAYFKGGHEQAVEALKSNLDISIDDYATFNWKAVADAINVLGGVDIEITDKEFAYINSFITETVNSTGVGSVHLERSGMNHLDGVQAVAYARLRLMDTDFNRTERQRRVLGQAMEKAKQADFSTLKNLVGAVYPQISTSIGLDDLLGIAKNARKYYIGQTSGFPFSHQEMKIGKKSCVIPTTLASNVTELHSFLYDDAQYSPSEGVKEISAHIAKVSGLSEPGKNTESGKNVGASGGSGGDQGKKPSAQPEKSPETEPAEPENESTEESESVEESASESANVEESTIAPFEETEEENSYTKPSGNDAQGDPGASDAGKEPEVGPGVNPPERPSGFPGNTEEGPRETHGLLEAPGQNMETKSEERGPGV